MGARSVSVAADGHDELLCHLMAEHNAACPRCGRALRGIRGDSCPGCGRGFEVRMGLVRPRGRAFTAGLIGLATGTGFTGLLLAYFMFKFWRSGWKMSWSDEVATWAAVAVIEGVLLGVWVYQGARLRRLSPAARGALVALAWAATTADLALFVLLA